ncbi:FG-GAP repeat domain-containing protein [Tautonia sociabilis]|uniref:VCBS repeat-containing protein n=1 Tax=Tautonia sociabilis TaxID=2080755 RepID=A0A432MIU6_9BACT|nr:VCBS repeat-containing protein [Tautonia sociabilis]RUL87219.1 VCBS repeat-containing protein [Tautonia sociabilis]
MDHLSSRGAVGFYLALSSLALSSPAGGAAPTLQEPPPEVRLAEYYGFLPLEIYKLDDRISGLLIADLDGDGQGDIAVADNARSRIDLLLTTEGPSDEDGTFGFGPNRLPSSRRMRIVTIPVNKEIVSLQAGDLDSDGKIDLAFYGKPPELTILYNEGEGRFGRPRRIATGPASETGSALAVGDLDRDGRSDLALITSQEVITVLQQEDGSLGRPERLPHTAPRPGVLKLVDIDGDGGDDLSILSGGDDYPIRIRFSRPGGRLGPEERFEIASARAVAYGELDGEPGQEVLTIESQTGRAVVHALRRGPAPGEERKGRLIVYPLPPGSTRNRALAVGDLNGDGRPDVVTTDPSNAQVFVTLQDDPKSGLGAVTTYPGLVGGSALRLSDLDGDGRDELIVLSQQEKQIGLSRLEDGRLSFPTALPISGGDPIGLAAADLDGDARPEVLYLAREKVEGKDSYSLRGLKRADSGEFAPLRWGQVDAVPIDGLTGPPKDVKVLDVNRDGLLDILVFDPYAPPVLLLGRGGGEPPARSASRPGPLAGLDPSGLTVSELDDGGPAILVAQGTFARSIALDESGQWAVRDQFNSGRTTAQLQAAAAIDLDGDGSREVALLDRTSRSLLILEKPEGGGSYRSVGALPIGPIDFLGLHTGDFDGDGTEDLLIAGTDTFGVVLTGGDGFRLERLASFATDRQDGRLADLIVGDLNADGVPDVVLTDRVEHFIDILAFANGELHRGLSFQVFEQKSFNGIDVLIEPREIALGDVDGDGRTDLALIVHDRVLVYRQDPGESTSPAADVAGDGEGTSEPEAPAVAGPEEGDR